MQSGSETCCPLTATLTAQQLEQPLKSSAGTTCALNLYLPASLAQAHCVRPRLLAAGLAGKESLHLPLQIALIVIVVPSIEQAYHLQSIATDRQTIMSAMAVLQLSLSHPLSGCGGFQARTACSKCMKSSAASM